MAITAVGTIEGNAGTALTSFSMAPTSVGNCFPLAIAVYTGSALTVTGVSGGNCTWAFCGRYADTGGSSKREMWLGTATATGTATCTITYSASVAGNPVELDAQEFTNGTGAGTTWALDGAVAGTTNTASTSCTFPSLTPTAAGEIYFAHWFTSSSHLTTSPTSGYVVAQDPFTDGILYNPSCTGSTQSPTGTIASSNASSTIAMLVAVTPPGGGGVTLSKTPTGNRARYRAASW